MFLALKELNHAKFRYVLIGIIMVLTAFLVFFVSGLAQGLASADSSAVRALHADYLLLNKEAAGNLSQSELNEQALTTARAQLGSGHADPLSIQLGTVSRANSGKKTYISFFATDMNGRLAPKISEGRTISNNTNHEVVVNDSIRNSGFSIGDKMKETVTGTEFTIVGFIKDQTFSHAPAAYINLKEQKLLQSAYPNKLHFNTLIIHGTKADADALAEKLDTAEVKNIDEVIKGIPGYSETQGSLTMMMTFLFIISAVISTVFFYVMTLQKTGQFGILKAIGARTRYLALGIIVQVLLLTAISLVMSALLCYGVASILPPSMPFELSQALILKCSVVFLIVDLLGSLISLRRVAKADAIKAIGGAGL